MPLRVCVSNCLELMGQTLLGFNIRYANSSHRFYSLQHRLKLFMKLTFKTTNKEEGHFTDHSGAP